MPIPRVDELDDLLTRIRHVRQRPAWRRKLLAGMDSVMTLSTLRALRAAEGCEEKGSGASVGDVAEYMAVEHSTASRTVAGVVAAGLLNKTTGRHDQRRCELTLTPAGRCELAKVTARRHELVGDAVADWAERDIDILVTLLERLAVDLERFTAT